MDHKGGNVWIRAAGFRKETLIVRNDKPTKRRAALQALPVNRIINMPFVLLPFITSRSKRLNGSLHNKICSRKHE